MILRIHNNLKKLLFFILSIIAFLCFSFYFSNNFNKSVKDAFINSKLLSNIYMYFRDKEYIDKDHVLTTLDNGLKIIVNLHDSCVSKFVRITGRWDSNETAALNNIIKPGFTIIEVGSNFGAHTLRMANLVGNKGKIYAFEANYNITKYLKQSINLNNMHHIVTVYENAVGDKLEDVYLNFSGVDVAHNFGGNSISQIASKGKIKVPMVTLDSKLKDLNQHIDLLKIDAEGCEAKIIAGALGIINNSPNMLLMIEWSPNMLKQQGSDPEQFLTQLKDLGFHNIYKVSPHKNRKANLEKISFAELVSIDYGDFVFVRNNKNLDQILSLT